ncbi:unnamed protein product [Agarophyton chilense]
MALLVSQVEAIQNQIVAQPATQSPSAITVEQTTGTLSPPTSTHFTSSAPSLLSILKPSNFSPYHDRDSDRTSVKVRSFISGDRKVTTLGSSITDTQEVHIAACLANDDADIWISRVNRDAVSFCTLEALQDAMLQEFVPANERAMIRVTLIELHIGDGALETHITKCRELVDICSTLVS